MICNGCGFYYSNLLSECPECEYNNDGKKITKEKPKIETIVNIDHVDINNQEWISYIKCKYKNIDDSVFAPINEKWNREQSIKAILNNNKGELNAM